MSNTSTPAAHFLDELESFYGRQEPDWPVEPYLFLVWWQCGYPPSDLACAKGWKALCASIGTTPEKVLSASPARLAAALKPGGMMPELRGLRIKEIAARVKDEFAGNLRAVLMGPLDPARRTLKKFPSIADPGADRILLFADIAPVSAVPSNCPHVLVRMQQGKEPKNYNATYREAQRLIEAQVPATADSRQRAYLLLKRHGQEICKRAKPRCTACPVSSQCAFFAGKSRG